jgi:putative Ca2+/H+ antiporter (TMEM165/GDT1 family)
VRGTDLRSVGRDLRDTSLRWRARSLPGPGASALPKGAPLSVVTALIVFVAIFFGELPDKTALASLMLGTRYKASLVFTGVAAGFLVSVAIAIAAGSLLRLIPHRPLQVVVAVLFAAGAVLLLREGSDDDEDEQEAPAAGLSPLRVVITSFVVIVVAEFGDITQILTANFAAKYHDPVPVAIGAVLALWCVGALAIVGGQALLRRISLRLITRIAAAIMVVLAGVSVLQAIRG